MQLKVGYGKFTFKAFKAHAEKNTKSMHMQNERKTERKKTEIIC